MNSWDSVKSRYGIVLMDSRINCTLSYPRHLLLPFGIRVNAYTLNIEMQVISYYKDLSLLKFGSVNVCVCAHALMCVCSFSVYDFKEYP